MSLTGVGKLGLPWWNYDGSGELSKRVERAKAKIERLHYKDEKVFPFEKFITKLKENFNVLEKDKHENLSGRQRVNLVTKVIRSTDARVLAGLVNVHQNFRYSFDEAANFMSGLISSIHSSAQLNYANRHGSKRRYVSAMGSNDQRGGLGRSRQGGRSSQRGGRGDGRGRDGRGRGRNNDRRTYANNVDITDPHRSFSSEEWDRLGTMRSYILQLREGGRGGRGRGDRNQSDRTVGSATATNNTASSNVNNNASGDQQSVVSEISARGSQNGRGFGRGAYNA